MDDYFSNWVSIEQKPYIKGTKMGFFVTFTAENVILISYNQNKQALLVNVTLTLGNYTYSSFHSSLKPFSLNTGPISRCPH